MYLFKENSLPYRYGKCCRRSAEDMNGVASASVPRIALTLPNRPSTKCPTVVREGIDFGRDSIARVEKSRVCPPAYASSQSCPPFWGTDHVPPLFSLSHTLSAACIRRGWRIHARQHSRHGVSLKLRRLCRPNRPKRN